MASIKRAAKLNPSLYYRGLLEVCAEAGVTLSAETRVDAIDGTKGHFTVKTSKGDIAAEQVIITTNGYTGPLTPKLRKRLVPISSQIIGTEELPEDMARELIPAGRNISETGSSAVAEVAAFSVPHSAFIDIFRLSEAR